MKLLILCCLAIGLIAQTRNATGTFTGKVMAPDGAAVSSAKVVVTNSGGEARNAVSGADGVFSVTGLPEGTYRVDITVPGFKKLSQSNVQVTDGSPLNLKFGLEREPSGFGRLFHRKKPTDSASEKK